MVFPQISLDQPIEQLYQTYRRIGGVTEAQKQYLRGLVEPGRSDEGSDSKVLAQLGDRLGRSIQAWSDLSRPEVSQLIRSLRWDQIQRQKQQPLRHYQIRELMVGSRACLETRPQACLETRPQACLETLAMRLNRPLRSWRDLTYGDYLRLRPNRPKTRPSFCLVPKERPLFIAKDYEYGYQINDRIQFDSEPPNRMYYLKFFDLAMLDYDGLSLDLVKAKLKTQEHRYRIYETFNGYHVFITSRRFHHRSPEVMELMKELGCDEWYRQFSYHYGYKVRISRKRRHHGPEPFVARYCETVNPDLPEDPFCAALMAVHDRYLGLG